MGELPSIAATAAAAAGPAVLPFVVAQTVSDYTAALWAYLSGSSVTPKEILHPEQVYQAPPAPTPPPPPADPIDPGPDAIAEIAASAAAATKAQYDEFFRQQAGAIEAEAGANAWTLPQLPGGSPTTWVLVAAGIVGVVALLSLVKK